MTGFWDTLRVWECQSKTPLPIAGRQDETYTIACVGDSLMIPHSPNRLFSKFKIEFWLSLRGDCRGSQ